MIISTGHYLVRATSLCYKVGLINCSLFTDAAGAITLAYEKPEMDLLLRPPRNAKTDRLVNTRFIMHAYGFIGIYECLLSFVMAFWYMDVSKADSSLPAHSRTALLIRKPETRHPI